MFKDKTLLITGGTGSFGHAVLDRFIDTGIKEIRIFSRDEKKQDDMRTEYRNNPKIKFYIGDVRDIDSVKNAMHGVDYIFHAAALKQVPSCEFFPIEAVKTNVLGTDNVLSAAIEYGVKKVICLSTDKAAYPFKLEVIDYETKPNPYNHYGKSKLQAEKLLLPLECVSYKIAIIRPPIIYGPGCKGNFSRLQKLAKYTVVFPNIENKRSMLYIDNLCEFTKQIIDQERCGVFFPQNSEYVSTQCIVLTLRSISKNATIRFYMTKLSIFNKIFGNKVYATQMSLGEYRIVDFEESLKRIANGE